jgi:nucleoporin SEH1
MNFIEASQHHDDLIHDIAFDYYGKRFATCGSDKHIKVWALNEEKESWHVTDISRAHQNSVWRLSWANPEYGQLVASCSEDGCICVWEEQDSTSSASDLQRWIRKIKLKISKKSVNDCKFGHRSLGLKLGSVSADGFLRIYEAKNIFELNEWELVVSSEVH